MVRDFSTIIEKEVNELRSLFSILLKNGNYELKESSIEQITFQNSVGNELVFIYDTNRYSIGKHMPLLGIKVIINSKLYSLGQLMLLKNAEFDEQEYFNSERQQGVSRKLASVKLINNQLLQFLI